MSHTEEDEYLEWLRKLRACPEAIEWAAQYKNPAEAWEKCSRGDWMLWLLGRLSGQAESESRKRLVLAACACVRLALNRVPKGEKRPRKAIVTAERWAKGEGVTLRDVRHAASAAYAAYAAAAEKRNALKRCADIVRKFYPKPPKAAS